MMKLPEGKLGRAMDALTMAARDRGYRTTLLGREPEGSNAWTVLLEGRRATERAPEIPTLHLRVVRPFGSGGAVIWWLEDRSAATVRRTRAFLSLNRLEDGLIFLDKGDVTCGRKTR